MSLIQSFALTVIVILGAVFSIIGAIILVKVTEGWAALVVPFGTVWWIVHVCTAYPKRIKKLEEDR